MFFSRFLSLWRFWLWWQSDCWPCPAMWLLRWCSTSSAAASTPPTARLGISFSFCWWQSLSASFSFSTQLPSQRASDGSANGFQNCKKYFYLCRFPAWWAAFYYKYEESKKAFRVILKPRQILSIVSTLNWPPRRAVVWIVEYDIPHFFANTHRFISRSCIKSWTRLIVSTKFPPIFLVQNFSNNLESLLWRYKNRHDPFQPGRSRWTSS